MNVVCIISEYNPFHNGHLHQIEMIRERFGNDCAVISIMSGNFVQRGGPAVLDKWNRARTALACGVDLVIELPAVYAASSAELFAEGGVAAADATGLFCHLVFGSEAGDLGPLERISVILADEPERYRELLRSYLDEGNSYPVSRSMALTDFTGDPAISRHLASSNNILAVEYLKAIRKRHITQVKPCTFKREGSGYNEQSFDPDIHPSASAIRNLLNSGENSPAELLLSLSSGIPSYSAAVLMHGILKKEVIISPDAFSSEIFTRLLTSGRSQLSEYAGMIEGLNNRLMEAARSGDLNDSSVTEIVDSASTRRYPASTVRRALFAMLLGITDDDIRTAYSASAPFYLRILGFSRKGRYLLKLMRKSARCPVITRCSDFREFPRSEKNKDLLRLADIDISSTDIWMQKTTGECGKDFRTPPISYHR